jgi:hypothetical protein
MAQPMKNGREKKLKKIEVLTANYPIAVTPDSRSKKELVTGEEAVKK